MIRISILTVALVLLAPMAPTGCPMVGDPNDGTTTGDRGVIPTTAGISPTQATVGQAVTLSATVEPVAGGGEVRYSWLQVAGSGTTIASSDQATATFNAPSVQQDQTLWFLVTTQDEQGNVGRDEVSLTVAADPDYGQRDWPNTNPDGNTSNAPEAKAGDDQDTVTGDKVSLDGSSSTGRDLTYQWRQTSGRNVTLASAATEKATFTAPTYVPNGDNELVFQLRVTDSRARTSSDTVIVTILDPATIGPRVKLVTTYGDIIVELYPDEAPKSVENFLSYVDDGFYTDTIFHRVIPGFVVQGGGFTADLTQKETNDPIVLESDNGLSNTRGTMAMARTTAPDSATSQFYFNLVDNSASLDYKDSGNPGYAVFGRVFSGMDVVDRIATVQTATRNGMQDVPTQEIYIRSATRLDN